MNEFFLIAASDYPAPNPAASAVGGIVGMMLLAILCPLKPSLRSSELIQPILAKNFEAYRSKKNAGCPIDESTKEDPDFLITEIPEKILAVPQR